MLKKLFFSRLNTFLAFVMKKYNLIVLVFLLTLVLSFSLTKITAQQGLKGTFFSNDSWNEPAVATEINKKIHFEKTKMSKIAGYSEKYSIIWEGFLFVPKDSGYFFSINSDDGSWVYVDDSLLIDNGDRHGPIRQTKKIFLPRGNHKIKIKYFDAGGYGLIEFYVKRTGDLSRILPQLPLYPNPVYKSQYRLDRILTYLNIFISIFLYLTGIAVLFTTSRKIFGRLDFFSLLILCLFLILVFRYGSEIFTKKSTAVAGCDSYAYLQGAVNMAQNGLFHTEFVDPLIPRVYQNYKVKPNDDMVQFLLSPHGHFVYNLQKGLIYNVFPPGMSFFLLPFVKIGGVSSSFYVLPFLNLIFVILFFYFGAKYVDIFFGICLSAFVFFNRDVFENSVLIMSDLPSMIFLALSLFLLFLNIKTSKRYFIFLAGAVFGFSLMLRYPNLVGGVSILYLFLVKFMKNKKLKEIFKDLLCFGAASFLLGFLPLAIYTHRLFGTLLRIIYEPITSSKMSIANFSGGAIFQGEILLKSYGWLGIAVIFLGLAASLIERKKRTLGLLGLLHYFSFFIFYAFQSIRHERYLMPSLPILGVLYAFGAITLTKKLNKLKLLKFFIITFLAIYPLYRSINKYDMGNFSEEKISMQIKKKVEKNAVIFCDLLTGPLRLYSGFSAFRHNWTPDFVLRDTLAILESFNIPVYFFLDSLPADEHFKVLINRGYLETSRIHFISQINGISLYKYGED